MQEVQLYIENQRVELFNDESISLTQSIQNIKDVSKVFTDFSKSFSIPASKENNKIFKHYYNFDIDNGFDARKKASAKIELNTIPFKEGKVKLEGVDMKNNKPYAYRITFFGNTINLKDKLGETKLSALTWLDNFSYQYDATNVRTLLQANGASFSISGTNYLNAMICPLIAAKTQLYYNTSTHTAEFPDPQGGNLYWEAGGSGHHHGVYWEELKYAIRIYLIVKAIEEEEGLDIEFTSDSFIKQLDNPQFYGLYMWLHKKKGYSFDEANPIVSLYNSFIFNAVAMTRATLYNDKLLITGLTGAEVINYDLNISTAYSQDYTIYIKKDGVDYIAPVLVAGGGNATITGTLTNTFTGYQVYIGTDNTITSLTAEWDLTDIPLGESNTYTGNSQAISAVRQFNAQEQIPDMKIIDFLTGLFKMFNLTAYQQNDGKIRVLPLDDYYAEGVSRDITKYVDVESGSVNLALPYKEIAFEYAKRGTIVAKQYEETNEIGWGTLEYKGGDNLDGEIYKVQAPFEHMQFERLPDLNDFSLTDIQVGNFLDDNQDPYFGAPLLFYKYRKVLGTSISFLNEVTGSKSEVTTYCIPMNSVDIDADSDDNTSHFSVEINEYTPADNFDGSLFANYYQNYISDVFSSKRRLTKVKAKLPVSFLTSYTLADTLIIGDRSYKINSINTNLNTGDSELELLNIVS